MNEFQTWCSSRELWVTSLEPRCELRASDVLAEKWIAKSNNKKKERKERGICVVAGISIFSWSVFSKCVLWTQRIQDPVQELWKSCTHWSQVTKYYARQSFLRGYKISEITNMCEVPAVAFKKKKLSPVTQLEAYLLCLLWSRSFCIHKFAGQLWFYFRNIFGFFPLCWPF